MNRIAVLGNRLSSMTIVIFEPTMPHAYLNVLEELGEVSIEVSEVTIRSCHNLFLNSVQIYGVIYHLVILGMSANKHGLSMYLSHKWLGAHSHNSIHIV